MVILDFSPVKRAGLTYSELARLCNVTRACARLWILGPFIPRAANAEKLQELLPAMDKAVELGLLPLRGTKKRNRDAEIAEALRQGAESLAQ